MYGYSSPTDYQMSVGKALLKLPTMTLCFLTGKHGQRVNILHEVDGLVLPGERLCVLGPPGSVPPERISRYEDEYFDLKRSIEPNYIQKIKSNLRLAPPLRCSSSGSKSTYDLSMSLQVFMCFVVIVSVNAVS